ncbi:Metallo-dependent phosphatase-like protein [Collybia nuda]|uniref:Metallo-dependent phosphatase-like protein n=1 Tax=Collybia nuda TaxID=64659 RepID=A0A9P5Y5I5_9AGAR|nr:Metallo-dependent phosphatase-like protein [Collybia nuda]
MLAFKALVLALGIVEVSSSPAQAPLQAATIKPRKLHGRFLQLTDMHPDPHYTPGSSQTSACHRKKPKHDTRAGYYGTPFSECDAPLRLINFTLDFIDKKWAAGLDFVIWTGDNARHDDDPKLPRTTDEIYQLNREVASKMIDVFLSKGIPVVPSLGNNDVWPHNIMTPGPNSITNQFSLIWESFIPFPNLQVFHRGAYYSVEVIPGEVAVISLNTMYFYDSNKAVAGCPFKGRDDPGNLQLDWLEVQLRSYRNRGMQVWLSGHVPPTPGNYFPECYVRYVELSLRFQDTILGHLFGHMNADHFSFLEAIDLQFLPENQDRSRFEREELYETLLREYSALPTSSKELDFGDYGVVNVSPPVVPNPYLPSFRVFSYNTTSSGVGTSAKKKKGSKRKHGHRRGDHGNKDSHCAKEEYKNTWKCYLNETWYSDPDSPSRSNTRWTPLGYAQFYIPSLETANKTHRPRFKLEYLTYVPELLHPPSTNADSIRGFQYPIPLEHLPRSLRNSNVTWSKYAPYRMADLTIPSWVGLAQKLGDSKDTKLRKRFRKYMYMGGEEG